MHARPPALLHRSYEAGIRARRARRLPWLLKDLSAFDMLVRESRDDETSARIEPTRIAYAVGQSDGPPHSCIAIHATRNRAQGVTRQHGVDLGKVARFPLDFLRFQISIAKLVECH